MKHSWRTSDTGIEQCIHCGTYKCTASPKVALLTGRRRKTDIEYSLPNGEVIAFNPKRVPNCITKEYNDPAMSGKWIGNDQTQGGNDDELTAMAQGDGLYTRREIDEIRADRKRDEMKDDRATGDTW